MKLKKETYAYLWITLGTALIAIAFNVLIKPNNLLVSGMGGVAILLAHFLPVSLGLIYFVLNIPLFLLGWRSVGTRFLIKSIWGTISLSIFLSLFSMLPILPSAFLGAIIGGILSGVGIGMVIAVGGTTGGTDIISVVVNQKYNWSVGSVMFVINAVIMAAGTYLFGWEKALLTIASLYVTSFVINQILKRYPPVQI